MHAGRLSGLSYYVTGTMREQKPLQTLKLLNTLSSVVARIKMIDVGDMVLKEWGRPSRRDCHVAAVLCNSNNTEVCLYRPM